MSSPVDRETLLTSHFVQISQEFEMVESMKLASFLLLFALCTFWASEAVSGHFSIGREFKMPFRDGHVNSQRNIESESHLRKDQRRTGNQSTIEAICAILGTNLLRKLL